MTGDCDLQICKPVLRQVFTGVAVCQRCCFQVAPLTVAQLVTIKLAPASAGAATVMSPSVSPYVATYEAEGHVQKLRKRVAVDPHSVCVG
jgi:hypothetical protein